MTGYTESRMATYLDLSRMFRRVEEAVGPRRADNVKRWAAGAPRESFSYTASLRLKDDVYRFQKLLDDSPYRWWLYR